MKITSRECYEILIKDIEYYGCYLKIRDYQGLGTIDLAIKCSVTEEELLREPNVPNTLAYRTIFLKKGLKVVEEREKEFKEILEQYKEENNE